MNYPMLFDFESLFSKAKTSEANIFRKENVVEIDLSLPGLSRTEIEVKVEEGVLRVSTAQAEEVEDDVRRSWSSHGYTVSWFLPSDAVTEQITARYEAGVLKIDIPLEEKEKGRLVPIE